MKRGTPALAAALALAVAIPPAGGQNVPPPSQAQSLLQAAQENPQLAELLRTRLRESGMTPDQIRARLRAGGYPESLLDAYIGEAAPGQAPAPGTSELLALRAIGLPPIELPRQPWLPMDTGIIRQRGESGASLVFGVDVFRRTTTQFLPLLSGPVPADYRLGPGDILVLILTGDVELAYTLQVTREGFILIPQVGQIFVSNLSLDQLRSQLWTRLGRVYSGVRRTNPTTRFEVSVANTRANQVYVVGEVAQPGAYQISALSTVLTGLYAAGGVTERANMRDISVRRAGKPVATLDLYDYLRTGNTRSDIRLETGDVVFVPLHGKRVQVTGAVLRPAIYELKDGESLNDLVQVAGGFRPNAALRRVAVHRILPAPERGPGPFPRAVVDVPLPVVPAGDPANGSSPHAPHALAGVLVPSLGLEDGDSVVVDSIGPLDSSFYVAIAGMVNKPGQYPWRDGMTLRDLVLLARGPKVGAWIQEAEVARLPEERSHGELATTVRVPLDSTYLFERDSAGHYIGPPGLPVPAAGAPEVALRPYDNVLILKQPEFDLQRTVTVAGEVRYPGTYSMRSKQERLAELVQRAGGLTPHAYPEGIRFVRAASEAGRLNIDLPRALRDTTSRDNVILQPGDWIVIPEYTPSVKVTGAVNSPGSVLWKRGANLDYYLSAAGGTASNADKGRVSVKFANGEIRTRHRSLFTSSDPKPGPGSEVVVPTRDANQRRTDPVAVLGVIAQIVASTVTIVVVLTR